MEAEGEESEGRRKKVKRGKYLVTEGAWALDSERSTQYADAVLKNGTLEAFITMNRSCRNKLNLSKGKDLWIKMLNMILSSS